ncbi:hypothetical protein A5653_10040 [Mycobacterium colombiense]|nr:hypothetical protein A5653_10040 [Mycobacterium colombiense]
MILLSDTPRDLVSAAQGVRPSEDNKSMRKKASVAAVHIVDGRPWQDALISVLERRSPYRPWRTSGGIRPGDAAIGVLDTDPQSVLAAVAIVGPDGDVGNAFANINPVSLTGLLELGTLNMLADFVVHPRSDDVYHSRSLDAVVAVIGGYNPSTADALFGHTSLAAGRILLKSGGKCTACDRRLDLTREDARDRLHIHTIDQPLVPRKPLRLMDAITEPEARQAHVAYSADQIKVSPRYPRSLPSDWPGVLCDSCHDMMGHGGFTSLLDFRLSLHPCCPSCSAHSALSAVYGMPAGPVQAPWVEPMGCCVEPWEWVCAKCGHQW